MPINAHPDYLKAEKEYLRAEGMEDRIYWLEEMIRWAPAHKGGENLRAGLKTRLKKFKEKLEKGKKTGKGKRGIRKEGFQFVLIGKTNRGKSLLLSKLTRASPKVGDYEFTTREAEIGTFDFRGVKAQMIDIPSIGCVDFDVGLANNADCLLEVVEDLKEVGEIEKVIPRAKGSRIVIVNKSDKLDVPGLRKLAARIKSKRVDGFIVSAKTGKGLDELRERLFVETGMIRIYLKEPGKAANKKRPLVLKKDSTLKNVAESILKGFSRTVKEARVTGPSSKFPNQRVGLAHKVKDLDVVEFKTR